MIRSIILILLFLTVPAIAAEAPDARLSDDIALAKATIALLAAKDFTSVRGRLDAGMGPAPDETLDRMSNLFGAGKPASVETISGTETRNVQTGAGNSRILLEYGVAGKWLVVDVAINTQADSKRFTRLYITANNQPLRELNAFHFYGKGLVQYLFLAGWLTVIALTAFAMLIAFRRHAGWSRWALILSMPTGLTPTVAVNWNTAQIWVIEAVSNSAGEVIPIFAFRYPMAMYGQTEIHVVYLYVSAPLIALGYLFWHWWQGRRPMVPLVSTTPTAE